MDLQPVREAYSSMSEQYIGLVGNGSHEHEDDMALVRRHLAGLAGPVLDLGCGPGHWTSYLHSLGADVTGVEMVPEFVEHARASHPELVFRQGSMTELDIPDHSVSGILSWYSTIHLSPSELDRALIEFRRLLAPSGVLVAGFFDSEDRVTQFDHKVITAYRWPADVFSSRLVRAGFVEVERLQRHVAERPDRRYAAIAAHESRSGAVAGACQPARASRTSALRPPAPLRPLPVAPSASGCLRRRRHDVLHCCYDVRSIRRELRAGPPVRSGRKGVADANHERTAGQQPVDLVRLMRQDPSTS